MRKGAGVVTEIPVDRPVVDRYAARLASHGVTDYSPDTVWHDYRLATAFALRRRWLDPGEVARVLDCYGLSMPKAELVKTRELAVEERRQLTEEIARLQQKMAEAAAAAATVAAERDSLDTARDSLARERAQLAAELDRLRKAADRTGKG